MHFLKYHISKANKNSTVVFLGDNIHPQGLPGPGDHDRRTAEESILAQIGLLEEYPGRVIMIPGNHDWANGREKGWSRIINQQNFLKENLKRDTVLLPENGSAGPVEVRLDQDIVLIVFDSHWWFHEGNKNYEGVDDEDDLLVQIQDAVRRYPGETVIFATHYPLFSDGVYGGRFPWQDFIFPLRNIHAALWVPMPGFIYTGYRKVMGSRWDISNPHYQVLKRHLLTSFSTQPNLIYAAGHEHNLQYLDTLGFHHIISGSAGGASYVSRRGNMEYARSLPGFARIDFYENGQVWLEFQVLEGETDRPDRVAGHTDFRRMLFRQEAKEPGTTPEANFMQVLSDSVVNAAPHGEAFKAGRLKKALLGENYRLQWNLSVEVPVFDVNHEQGGMKIIKRGGGDQTKSLRLEDRQGKQWVLRSLDKYPASVIPETVRVKLAEDVVKDQMSASLPWAALAIPRLAAAAGLYHTNPGVRFVYSDSRLGIYKDYLPEGLYLLEERPDGNRDDLKSFGFSKKIISTSKMLENLIKDPENRIDQEMFLRSRMVDMLISDWDRHEDQWRWATFKQDGIRVHRPIPRDRDMAFYVSEGLLIRLSAKSPYLRKMQGLDYQVKDIKGLNLQARHLDRRLLNELSFEEWNDIAMELVSRLPDSVLSAAVNDMPAPIANSTGGEIISKLKARRDSLPGLAEEYYRVLNKKVEVVGTRKKDYFLIERMDSDSTRVSIFDRYRPDMDHLPFYRRTFNHAETREIHVYGLEGNDVFQVAGEVRKGLKVRLVPGEGNDIVMDSSLVDGASHHTVIYDQTDGFELHTLSESRSRESRNNDRYAYRYDAFEYNVFMPLVLAGYNPDDGVRIGAGATYTTYGFMKAPYSGKHRIRLDYFTATNALELSYEVIYPQMMGNWDFKGYFHIRDPKYTQNFFGWGNETIKTESDPDYYRIRIGQTFINPQIQRRVWDHGLLEAGLFYQRDKVENTTGRFIAVLGNDVLDSGVFSRKIYAGMNSGFIYDNRDNVVFPVRGVHWISKARVYIPMEDMNRMHLRLSSEAAFFLSFRKPYRVVLALRAGGAVNFGNYEFYQSVAIGGKENLRGFRDTRYSGDASFYQNTELRVRLWKVKSYISKGHFGILLFNDVGRVWYHDEKSSRWHQGFGGGIWVSPFGMAIINALYEISVDEPHGIFSLRFGFLF